MLEIYRLIKKDLSALDRQAIFALVYTAAALTSVYYLKNIDNIIWLTRDTPLEEITNFIAAPASTNLLPLTYWFVLVMIFYFAIPAVVIKFLHKKDVRDYGLNFRIERGFFILLIQCTIFMLPLVYLMSLTSGFAEKYPFLVVYDGSHYFSRALLAWELIYFIQFFGLEFFFRGYLLHSLKPALGAYSIFAMTVPYCMIHFGKPAAETFSAIFAGIFLGWLSYRNGNIWMGLILHCAVAFLMDILALYNKGLLF